MHEVAFCGTHARRSRAQVWLERHVSTMTHALLMQATTVFSWHLVVPFVHGSGRHVHVAGSHVFVEPQDCSKVHTPCEHRKMAFSSHCREPLMHSVASMTSAQAGMRSAQSAISGCLGDIIFPVKRYVVQRNRNDAKQV